MQLRETKETEVVVGYVCDICHLPCYRDEGEHRLDSSEWATLSAEWGYWSNGKDLTWHECHMCEPCFEKVKKFIEEELGGEVRTGQSEP